jgi:hypothetical protein
MIFSLSLPFALFIFTLKYLIMFWVHVMHVMNMLWVLGICNMSLNMLCALWNIHNMDGYEFKMCSGITQFVFLKYEWGKG